MKKTLSLATLGLVLTMSTLGIAQAQVAGATTLGVAVTDVDQLAMGWSARKSILGKFIYNESGDRIGKVQDLIIDPDKKLSYLIVAVGGFVGMGQHAVAVTTDKIVRQGGKFVLPGATKDAVRAMPAFEYVSDTRRHDELVAAAERDVALAKEKIGDLQKRSEAGAAEAKAGMDRQIASLKLDQKAVEDKLAEMKVAGEARWKGLEADLGKAAARLRKSLDKTTA